MAFRLLADVTVLLHLLELDAARVGFSPSLLLCCRCFLVWLDRPALQALRLAQPRVRSAIREAGALAEARALAEPAQAALEARDTCSSRSLRRRAAGVLESVLRGDPAA